MHIKVRAYPNSKKEKVIKKSEDSFEVYVKEKAERGEANKALRSALSSYLKIPVGKLRLVKGAKSRSKIFKVGL